MLIYTCSITHLSILLKLQDTAVVEPDHHRSESIGQLASHLLAHITILNMTYDYEVTEWIYFVKSSRYTNI